MIDDERLAALLRSAFEGTALPKPSRDLWPLVAAHMDARVRPSWFDIGLAAVIVIALVAFPGWLSFLAYHL